ncbi:MAG: hypothetical protein IMW88_01585 [Thermoflavifilum sp.]|uniref:hypothetical protein n=1 Tax=Thermoflavifilum sp. TaxID=1968839 RepID=UPI0018A5AC24|nr:hypothetical protein [Thermoflavifilum sp.]QOR76291.1 MAG: hypothetical protein IMW88_01585 [Thermoflavifilum sp.]
MIGINLNSDTDAPKYIWNKIYGRLTYLTPAYERVPIYLVDEATMDRIHPPERSLSMDVLKERLPGIMGRLEEEAERMREEELPRWASIIEEGLNACFTSQMSALGAYFHDFQPQPELAHDLTNILEERTKYDKALKEQIRAQHPRLPAGEVIFICPERIYRHEKPELLFQKVVIHELAHAYVGGERNEDYRRGYGRVIEESLANAVALSHFRRKETPALKAFIATQPPEYRGCYFWIDNLSTNEHLFMRYHLEHWRNRPVNLLLAKHVFRHPIFRDPDEFEFFIHKIFRRQPLSYWYFLDHWGFPREILKDALEQNYEKNNHRPLCNLISLAILQFVAEQG